MKFQTIRNLVLFVLGVFLVVSFWSDPTSSADSVGNFVGSVGGFFSTVIDKSVQFVKGLAD